MWVSKQWLKEKEFELSLKKRDLEDSEFRIGSEDRKAYLENEVKIGELAAKRELFSLNEALTAQKIKFDQMDSYYSKLLEQKDLEISRMQSTIHQLVEKIPQPKDATFNQSIVK